MTVSYIEPPRLTLPPLDERPRLRNGVVLRVRRVVRVRRPELGECAGGVESAHLKTPLTPNVAGHHGRRSVTPRKCRSSGEMAPGFYRRCYENPWSRSGILLALCPTLWVTGGLLMQDSLFPYPLDVSIGSLFLVASAACPILLLIDLTRWVLTVLGRVVVRAGLRRNQ